MVKPKFSGILRIFISISGIPMIKLLFRTIWENCKGLVRTYVSYINAGDMLEANCMGACDIWLVVSVAHGVRAGDLCLYVVIWYHPGHLTFFLRTSSSQTNLNVATISWICVNKLEVTKREARLLFNKDILGQKQLWVVTYRENFVYFTIPLFIKLRYFFWQYKEWFEWHHIMKTRNLCMMIWPTRNKWAQLPCR